ncbi:MAG: hypothetical protein ACI4RC_04260 [Oscillospiraceae bacterium]
MSKTVGLVFTDINDDIGNDIILEDMTVPQLKQFATDNNIDIGSATKKDDIVQSIINAGQLGSEV